ncbi:MAG: glycosyltransferase family 9 protein [Desulfobulbaceae bacterium]|nr:glycosyltransferase family 9 protein [Desulfobulbaceae bacterium]
MAEGLHRFLENHPLIDRLWIFKKEKWRQRERLFSSLPEIAAFCKGLRREHFDISIDLSGLLRSGLMTFVAGARYKLGFKESHEGSPFFYNHKISTSTEIHAIDRYLKIPAYLGCPVDKVEYPFAPFPENPPIFETLPHEFCVMSPSAGKEANRWPADRFGRLAAKLPLPSLMISGKGDADVVEQAVSHSQGKAIDLAGKTSLPELIAIMRRARFLVTNDTGPMHISAACDTPVFAIFGPANPIRTGPYGTIHTVIKKDLPCAPCYRWKPCENWRCMEEITVDEVYEIINNKMKYLQPN